MDSSLPPPPDGDKPPPASTEAGPAHEEARVELDALQTMLPSPPEQRASSSGNEPAPRDEEAPSLNATPRDPS